MTSHLPDPSWLHKACRLSTDHPSSSSLVTSPDSAEDSYCVCVPYTLRSGDSSSGLLEASSSAVSLKNDELQGTLEPPASAGTCCLSKGADPPARVSGLHLLGGSAMLGNQQRVPKPSCCPWLSYFLAELCTEAPERGSESPWWRWAGEESRPISVWSIASRTDLPQGEAEGNTPHCVFRIVSQAEPPPARQLNGGQPQAPAS